MKELDGADSQADSALNCYRTALRELRANLVITNPDVKRDIQSRLDRLSVTVSRKIANEVLESTAARLTEILADYRNQEESAFEEEQRQLRVTIEALQALVAALRRQDEEHNANLNAVLSGLEGTLFEGDLLSIHRSLQDQIRKLRACVVAISDNAVSRESGFEAQIDCLKARSEKASTLAASRMQEQLIDAGAILDSYFETCTLFSLLLVKIRDFSQFAQHWSPSARSRLLSAIEQRLQSSLGTLDHLHPWTDGAFLVVMRSTQTRAAERAAKIREIVNGDWNIELPFGSAKIAVRCSVGVAEYVTGDDLSSLMTKVETSLNADGVEHPAL
jgi:GGDEF domain-containing protein